MVIFFLGNRSQSKYDRDIEKRKKDIIERHIE